MRPGASPHAHRGPVAQDELRRTFNLGLGMVVAVAPADVPAAMRVLGEQGETVFEVGEIGRRRDDGPEVEWASEQGKQE